MSKPIKITTDSTADLSPELIEKYNISITPLHIEMDGKSYSDGVDATPEDLFSYYDRTGKLAKSSACLLYTSNLADFNSKTAFCVPDYCLF